MTVCNGVSKNITTQSPGETGGPRVLSRPATSRSDQGRSEQGRSDPGRSGLSGAYAGCLATASRMLDRRVASVFDDRLRSVGLRSTQVTTLAAIEAGKDAGNEHKGDAGDAGDANSDRRLTATELGQRLGVDATTLSRNLARLASAGLIVRTPDVDARRSLLSLTDEGRAALARALPVWREAQREVSEALGTVLADALRDAASRLTTPVPAPVPAPAASAASRSDAPLRNGHIRRT